MQAPPRWKSVAVGQALGYNYQEIAAGLDTSVMKVSATADDIEETALQYDDPAEFLGELLGTDLESDLDADAIQAHRDDQDEDDED